MQYTMSTTKERTTMSFCTCPVVQCPRHPSNHDEGCDPCIKDNLEKGKMPACMFKAVSDDVDDVRDFSLQGFVDFYLKHHANPAEAAAE